MKTDMSRLTCLLLVLLPFLQTLTVTAAEPTAIGSRRELFVDEALIEAIKGKAELRLHHPVPHEVAIKFDQPWEGNASGYPTVFQDGDKLRMYYRGHRYIVDKPLRQAQPEVVCYAESSDGVTWTKHELNLFEWPGAKRNNIIWRGGPETHNFAPFKDSRPGVPAAQLYKAIGGTITSKGLVTFQSADGIHWSKLSAGPVVTEGAFDSHNTAFWDSAHSRYSMYLRYFSEKEYRGLRSIGVCYSSDFEHWSKPEGLKYPGSPPQQMYTNQVAPYHRAPHILLGFPTRYVARAVTEHIRHLPPIDLRGKLLKADERTGTDLSEGQFMASRDGLTFRRWDEAFLRPGPEAEGRWIYGDNYQSYGLFETKSPLSGTPELSMHFHEGAWRDDTDRLRRYTIRLDGFVSLHAALAGGELTTKPITFAGSRLLVNYSTSAAGSLRVALEEPGGKPIAGCSLDDSAEHFGDAIEQAISWKSGGDVGRLAGKPIRIRFALRDGNLFSYRFAN